MSQFDPVIGSDRSGLAYRQEDNSAKKALLSHHKGATPPNYAEAGIVWLDDTSTPWVFKTYDGTDWIEIGAVDATTNQYQTYALGAPLSMASETTAGLVEKATDSEVEGNSENGKYVAPSHLAQVLLSHQSANLDTWIDFTTKINATFDTYILHMTNVKVTNNDCDLSLQMSVNGVFQSGASDYEFRSFGIYTASNTEFPSFDSAADHIPFNSSLRLGNAAGKSFNAICKVFHPATAGSQTAIDGFSHYQYANGNVTAGNLFFGAYKNSVDVVDGFRIYPSAGSIASGEFKLYGVKKS